MKRLRKSENKVFAGVCGGIGEYFNIDPVIIRLVFCILTVSGVFFPGIIIYIVASIIIPAGGNDSVEKNDSYYENLKRADIPQDEKSAPHSDEEFNSYFKK